MVRERERKARSVPLKQLGAALAISFVGYLYSRFQTRQISASHASECSEIESESNAKESGAGEEANVHPSQKEEPFAPKTMAQLSTCNHRSVDPEQFLLPEFQELVNELDSSANPLEVSPRKHAEMPKSSIQSTLAPESCGLCDYELEIKQLNSMVRILRDRERILEVQLLEYYGLKEQENTMIELQNRLKINGMEAQLFTIKTESLQAENRRLEAQVANHFKVVGELEAARAIIKILKRKLRFETEQSKQQILELKKEVERLQEEEHKALAENQDVRAKLQRLKELEIETEDLRMTNEKLQQENSDLALRLQLAEVSIVEEQEAVNLKEENERLKQSNEELGEEVEQLRADRCADAEELVYLKWVNACLRYELRYKNPQAGKTVAVDLNNSLSPNSAGKAKKLILKYATTEGRGDEGFESDSDVSSSLASYPTESSNVEDSLAIDNSNPTTATNEPKFMRKLKKFLKIKPENGKAREKPGKVVTSLGDNTHMYTSETVSSSCSSSISTAADVSRLFTPPSSCDMDDIKELTRLQRTSTESSLNRFMKYSSARTSMSDRPDQDQDMSPVSDLLRYAEALRDSHDAFPCVHNKSKSFSAFRTQ